MLTVVVFELAQRLDLQHDLHSEIATKGVMVHAERNSSSIGHVRTINIHKLLLFGACIGEPMQLYPLMLTGRIRHTMGVKER